ncbi:hypothetical protein [Lentzea waywayandensis]|uniref:hypothetical protein n=1 Tax=Lentzea waywayandensis TaxID=84724 RepID=UPI0015A5F6CD|nr:hypothetical protein [Lentzea waywayandensis]
MKITIGGVGLVAAMLGAVAAPANAEVSGPETTVNGVVSSTEITVDVMPDVSRNAAPMLCLRGHVQDVGWQGWTCDAGNGAAAGTAGQGRRLEAIQFVTYDSGGVTCALAHVQDVGWQGRDCRNDGQVGQIGTTGQGRRIEAIGLGNTGRTTCARAHVQNQGWQDPVCEPANVYAYVGTTGQGLQMEALIASIL